MKLTRFFALSTAALMTASMMLGTLTGCKSNVTANGIYSEKITVGEWLRIVNQKFWAEESSASTGLSYEEELQRAVSYGVVPEDCVDLDLEEELTREVTALTLAGAIVFEDSNEVYINDIEDITYQKEVMTMINDGIMFLDDDNNFKPDEEVGYVEASEYLQLAYSFWASYTFEEKIYNCVLKENVIDMVGLSTTGVSEDNAFVTDEQYVEECKRIMDENHLQFNDDTYVLTVDDANALNITEGAILVIPDGYGNHGDRAVKVTGVEQQPDGTYVAQTEQALLTDVVDDLVVQQSEVLDLSDSSKCQFFDMEGNPLELSGSGSSVQPMSMEEETAQVVPLTYGTSVTTNLLGNNEMIQLDNELNPDNGKTEIEVKIKDTLKLYASTEGSKLVIRVSLGAEDTVEHFKNSKKFNKGKGEIINSLESEASIAVYEELVVDNIRVNQSVDVWDKYVRMTTDYNTSHNFGLVGEAETTWELFTLKYSFVPGLTMNLTFNLKWGFDGKLSVGVTTENCSKGFEFVNGNWRSVDEGTQYYDFEAEAQAHIIFQIEIGLSLIDEKICKIYGQFDAGAGTKMAASKNLVEFPNQEPYTINCVDVVIYPIVKLRVGLTIGKDTIIEMDVNHEWTLMDENHGGKQWKVHVEDGAAVEKCSAEVAKEEMQAYERDQEAITRNVALGDALCIDKSTIYLLVGESAEIHLTEIPQGYSLLNDVYATMVTPGVEDDAVKPIQLNNTESKSAEAFFNSLGSKLFNKIGGDGAHTTQFLTFRDNDTSTISITGVESGTAEILYKTKDGKYSIGCRIVVRTEDEADAAGLRLSESYISVAPGSSHKLEITSVPAAYTASDLIWESDNTAVATVDANGNVTGIADGVATISLKTSDGKHVYKCTVSVYAGAGENAADIWDRNVTAA